MNAAVTHARKDSPMRRDNRLPQFVLELQKQHRVLFDNDPVLLYGVAEALSRSGDGGNQATRFD